MERRAVRRQGGSVTVQNYKREKWTKIWREGGWC